MPRFRHSCGAGTPRRRQTDKRSRRPNREDRRASDQPLSSMARRQKLATDVLRAPTSEIRTSAVRAKSQANLPDSFPPLSADQVRTS
jgi:hypothetical protein